ncbi:MAG: methyltransferase domain-containing protein [Anaerolineales bacterium]|nr:methyltransferase domain-containing protein [Anaerolineales bacterium]
MGRADRLDDKRFLKRQYRDASNLNARVSIHRTFSTNPHGFLQWIFERLDLPPDCRLLELGCGSGELWRDNLGRIPEGWNLTLTDASAGMAQQARRNLASGGRLFRFALADAQAVPFPAAAFDAVIADHMLYHVRERPRALAEIRRVMRPAGRFYASTVGSGHMRELAELVSGFDPQLDVWRSGGLEEGFTLENGAEQIAALFREVTLQRYEDSLAVTELEPLIAYIQSGRMTVGEGRLGELKEYLKREMTRRGGVIRISKETGLFSAVRE